jgi:multicomponent K+:H+ antiporter subunit E
MKPGWLAHPVLSLLVASSWLLLQQSLAVGNLITAVVLALLVPRLVHGFLGVPVKAHAWRTALRLGGVVLYDIVISNIAVAKIVLSPAARPRPAWVVVPLDLRHPTGITLLATIITTTPGTVSCVIDEARHEILVHALDCDDAAEMATQMKQRYERPLMEIFE